MAALDVAGAMANVKTMLSALTAWQTICGVSSSSEAAKRIHYGGAEESDDDASQVPLITMNITSLPTNWVANHLRGTLTIELRFEVEPPDEERATFSDQYLWVWQQWSAVMAGINGAINGAGQLMVTAVDVPLMPGQIDPDENKGRDEWMWVVSLSTEFI